MDLSPRPSRQRRLNYRLLNDGSDEAAFEDRIQELPMAPDSVSSDELTSGVANSPDCEILPSQSIPQDPTSPVTMGSSSSIISQGSCTIQPRKRPASATEWMWAYFETTEYNRPWIMKRTKSKRPVDRDICCIYIDEHTGIRCNWKTTDSARQTSTSNMARHLEKHSIYAPDSNPGASDRKKQPSIADIFKGKQKLTVQQLLERNLLRWIVTEKQAFTTIEAPAFKQIFCDIPGITLPLSSRHTVRQRLVEDFTKQRLQLREELGSTCKTIALSLDIWTSKNHIPILGIIGHWLTEDFEYRERVLEFTELRGIHSGENLAAAVEEMLVELGLQSKLITITGDNARNNEVMVSELYDSLKAEDPEKEPLFQGEESFVRCLAHILNLIVKDILRTLKSDNIDEAFSACNDLRDGISRLASAGPLAKLRIFALWINRSPQRRQKWKEICNFLNLPNKFIQYDVETRWNSTFRMLNDGLQAKSQINKFLELQTDIPPFSSDDWLWLEQVQMVLAKFDEFTLLISAKKPQISLSLAIYYELHDLLYDASERKGEFSNLGYDIVSAVNQGMAKYRKYYSFMDETDTHYMALILDPRVKQNLILKELQAHQNSGAGIIKTMRQNLHLMYDSIDEDSPENLPLSAD
ncbi:ribonuclease H-like domain-containing protein [Lipomyces kononenkoae]